MQSDVHSRLEKAFSRQGLKVAFRLNNQSIWLDVSRRLSYIPVNYSNAMLDYQISYLISAVKGLEDLSVILYFNNQPCGIWPLLGSFSPAQILGVDPGNIVPPIFISGFPARSSKKIISSCLDLLDSFAIEGKNYKWSTKSSFASHNDLGIWHQRIMERGGSLLVKHELFIDLSLEISTIKLGFRKSYKSLISLGERLWRIFLLSTSDPMVWSEFRELHKKVSGRVTRSAESWDQQYSAILSNDAFLVYLRDSSGSMVGGGLFYITRDEGLYAVAAYDRSLFDKPLGHVVQMEAIKEMQRRSIRWYKIGARPYPSDLPSPSIKELKIAEFKQGFATHLLPSFELLRTLDQCQTVVEI